MAATVTSGNNVVDLSPYKSIIIEFRHDGVYRMKEYNVNTLSINKTIQDDFYVDSSHNLAYTFNRSSTGINIVGWTMNGWTFNSLVVYGVK